MKKIIFSLLLPFFTISACSVKPSFIVTESSQKQVIEVRKGDMFEIRLKARLGTGYSWKNIFTGEALEFSEEPVIEKAGESKPGSDEYMVFRFRALKAGEAVIEFHYIRPWEKNSPPQKKRTVSVRISPDRE